MKYEIITKPTVNVVSLGECKEHLRIKGNYADKVLLGLIAAAQDHIEQICGLYTITRKVKISLNDFPVRGWTLPVTPVTEVVSITYLDADEALQQVSADVFILDNDDFCPQVYKKSYKDWPTSRSDEFHRVFITVKAGYGVSANDVPPTIRQAIKFLVAHWFENRTPVVVGAVPISIPFTIDTMIKSFKRFRQ